MYFWIVMESMNLCDPFLCSVGRDAVNNCYFTLLFISLITYKLKCRPNRELWTLKEKWSIKKFKKLKCKFLGIRLTKIRNLMIYCYSISIKDSIHNKEDTFFYNKCLQEDTWGTTNLHLKNPFFLHPLIVFILPLLTLNFNLDKFTSLLRNFLSLVDARMQRISHRKS